ncbi:DUF192 domain-containing protein [Corallococcus sp. H22C18031201]|uniref:DUF192 domain-containing protein n=1 Tax=Citreicoccus inhibens TaxID=2849499 RepID=UPI000E71FDE5|nr:DUF192 domain-containing protein [Citreicoccus inhibens]MBU8894924.1 DUF192 domain-containing protein [Citreicoccus inhibens]RJS27088.1 DUF192 domain-containing protein [Corallococcus sp. H22C18031201]
MTRSLRAVALGAALLGVPGCQEAPAAPPPRPAAPRPASKDLSAEDYVMPALPRAAVRLKDAFGGVHRVEVEVAATADARTRGLMWRKSLPAGQGMLFIFPEEEVQSFWMRNTLIPLDMLFINAERRVVGIIERAEPRTLTGRSVGVPGLYVLEVPGGWCQSVGVARGGTVEFEGLGGVHAEP